MALLLSCRVCWTRINSNGKMKCKGQHMWQAAILAAQQRHTCSACLCDAPTGSSAYNSTFCNVPHSPSLKADTHLVLNWFSTDCPCSCQNAKHRSCLRHEEHPRRPRNVYCADDAVCQFHLGTHTILSKTTYGTMVMPIRSRPLIKRQASTALWQALLAGMLMFPVFPSLEGLLTSGFSVPELQ